MKTLRSRNIRLVRRVRHWASKHYRRLYHRINPWTGLNGLDRKLQDHFSFRGGVFLEVGANDGIRQSNTFYLEKKLGWTGILIEPIPTLARECRKNRKKSSTFEAALTAESESGTFVKFVDVDLMSTIFSGTSDSEHVELAEEIQGLTRKEYLVPAMTLTQVISVSTHSHVDFMSIDVEGHEVEVLRGLDLDKYCPDWLLVETSNLNQVIDVLSPVMSLVGSLSHHDYLFTRNTETQ